MLHSVRARLSLWYAGVFSACLVAFAVGIYIFVRNSSIARIDEYLEETASAVTGAMEFERHAGKPDSVAIADVVRDFRLRETDVIVLDRKSGVTYRARADVDPRSTSPLVTKVPVVSHINQMMRGAPDTTNSQRTVIESDEPVRIFTLPYSLGKRRLVIATVQRLKQQQRELRETELVLSIVLPIFLLIGTYGGYVLARKSLDPVAHMTDRAAVIGATSLHERLPVGDPRDELGRLASVFNDLLDRLEHAFLERRRFMEDASHELRTPVAVISGESELALSRTDRRPEELRDALRSIRAESKRLREIVDDLFLLARSEAGARPMHTGDLYLRDVIEECVRSARSLAAAKNIELLLEANEDDDLPCTGDEALLKRLLMNLLDNAVKYSGDGGRITVRGARVAGKYTVEVEDTGPGIPEPARRLVFERFYRAPSDQSNRPRPAGAGLGLSIARWVARAHDGDVELVRSGPAGSLFRVTLPAPGPARDTAPRPVPAGVA